MLNGAEAMKIWRRRMLDTEPYQIRMKNNATKMGDDVSELTNSEKTLNKDGKTCRKISVSLQLVLKYSFDNLEYS